MFRKYLEFISKTSLNFRYVHVPYPYPLVSVVARRCQALKPPQSHMGLLSTPPPPPPPLQHSSCASLHGALPAAKDAAGATPSTAASSLAL